MDSSILQPEFVDKVYGEILKRRSSSAPEIPPDVARTIKSVIAALLKDEAEYIQTAEQDVAPRKQQLLGRYAQEVLRRDAAVKRIDEAKEEAVRRLKRKLEAHDERWLRDGVKLAEDAGITIPDEWDFRESKWFGRVDPHRDLYEKALVAAQASIRGLKKDFDKKFLDDPLDNMEALEAHFAKLRQEAWDTHEAQAAFSYKEASKADDIARRADTIALFFDKPEIRSVFRDSLPDFFCAYISFIQPYLVERSGPKTGLINVLDQHSGSLLTTVFRTFILDPKDYEVRFVRIGAVLERNRTKLANEVTVEWMAEDSPLRPSEMIDMALRGSVLHSLFEVQVSMPETTTPEIEESLWYSHALLLAQTGFGKTNVIRWRIEQLLPQVAQGNASLIVMEPQGDLTRHLLHLAGLWNVRDRVVVLDPGERSVAVNLFEKPANNSPQALNATIGRIERVLGTITTNLTELQKVALSFALRALFATPNPSMRGLIQILRQGKSALDLAQLPPAIADYFTYYKDTEGGYIVARLNSLLANPIFESLFAAEQTTFHMNKEIDAGKLIIINASAAPNLYGNFWIEEVSRCIELRTTTDRHRMPTTFIIDEAQRFIAADQHFADILDRARAARIGMFVAAHHMEQITDAHVRHSLYTNTALKFVARTSADIHNLCRAMGGIDSDFITTLPQYQFAYFAPNMGKPERVKFPLVEFDKMPQMSSAQYEQMREENRRKYGYTPPASMATSMSLPEGPAPQPPQTSVSNRERVDRALDALRETLLPLVDAALTARKGESWAEELNDRGQLRRLPDGSLHIDRAALLRAMDRFWQDAFSPPLTRAHRSYVNELITVRNSFAHDEPFSDEDTDRATDTVNRLINAVTSAFRSLHGPQTSAKDTW